MKPRPLYRSLTFWAGVFVIGSIFWGWWDSMRAFSGFRFASCWANQAAGGVAMGLQRPRSSHSSMYRYATKADVLRLSGPNGGIAFALEVKHSVTPFPRPFATSHKGGGIFLPHWLVLLAAIFVWSGLLLWRGMRNRAASRRNGPHDPPGQFPA